MATHNLLELYDTTSSAVVYNTLLGTVLVLVGAFIALEATIQYLEYRAFFPIDPPGWVDGLVAARNGLLASSLLGFVALVAVDYLYLPD